MEALLEQATVIRDRLFELNAEKLAMEAERTAMSRNVQETNERVMDLERAASKLEQRIATSATENSPESKSSAARSSRTPFR